MLKPYPFSKAGITTYYPGDAAQDRSMRRFLASLNEQQRSDYKSHGVFVVESNLGNRFVINTNKHNFNVRRLTSDDGICVQLQSCFHASGIGHHHVEHPRPDLWLAQALVLRTDEAEFWKAMYR